MIEYTVTTGHEVSEFRLITTLLDPDAAPAPNRIWVTDFIYVPVYSGFVYVALVIDLYSRAIVGWETSTVKDTAFVEHCLRMALWRRQHAGRLAPAGLIHHSDAGSQSMQTDMPKG